MSEHELNRYLDQHRQVLTDVGRAFMLAVAARDVRQFNFLVLSITSIASSVKAALDDEMRMLAN